MPEPIGPARPGPKTEADIQAEIQGQSTIALTNLLDTLGTAPWKEMTKYTEEVNKSKKENWMAMGQMVKQLRIFGSEGGFLSVMGGSIARVKESLANQIEGMLAPITNTLSQEINTILSDIEPIFTGILQGLKSIEIGNTNLLEAILTAGTSLLYKNIDIITQASKDYDKARAVVWDFMNSGLTAEQYRNRYWEREAQERALQMPGSLSTKVYNLDYFWG